MGTYRALGVEVKQVRGFPGVDSPFLEAILLRTHKHGLDDQIMTFSSSIRALALAGMLCLSAGVAGCGANPFQLNWSADPDSALIFSLARPELNLPSGFDFALRRTVEIQEPGATGTWDLLMDTEGGDLVFRLPTFYNIASEARIAVFENMSFDQVLRAPEDTVDYVNDGAIPVRMGTTYVIQTHLGTDRFGQRCHFFAKMEPLAVDVAQGTLRFIFDRNPLCEDLDLVPRDSGN